MKFILLLTLPLLLIAQEPKNKQIQKNKIEHIIVIYLENRSFDNLFYGFTGTANSAKTAYKQQKDASGNIYTELPMNEESIAKGLPSSVKNEPFLLDNFISQDDIIPDLVHRYYQNILQINNGTNDRFAQISNAQGLVMGYHDMHKSHIWRYAKEFTLCDNFFAAAFGGSFLNHQWLIAAKTPFVGTDSNLSKYELDEDDEIISDGVLTPDGYAVNTIQPFYPPYKAKYNDPSKRLQPLTHTTIGDELSRKKISWGWYSGGYKAALEGNGDSVDYQYHHNPFLYFEAYKPNSAGREHLHDEDELLEGIKRSSLPSVVFFKPLSHDNQHPGYASVKRADEKLHALIESIRSNKKLWQGSLILVTYDENGGLWDHATPPKKDRWGAGTRVPALVISPLAKKGYIDHTTYDTTSILRLIEWRYNLKKIGKRDSANMLNALKL